MSGLILYAALAACSGPSEIDMSSYNLTVVGAESGKPLRFSGTYQFMRDKKRISRDFSGVGNATASFYADELVYVRIQGTKRDGIYSLTVTRDGEVVFDSPALPANRPIVYSNEASKNR